MFAEVGGNLPSGNYREGSGPPRFGSGLPCLQATVVPWLDNGMTTHIDICVGVLRSWPSGSRPRHPRRTGPLQHLTRKSRVSAPEHPQYQK
jgi:hypothetical protein